MRSWFVIAASVVLATLVTVSLHAPLGLPPSRAALTALLYAQWPGMAVVWLGSYCISALALTTAALSREIDKTGVLSTGSALERRRISGGWVRRFLVWLAITQYFSAILALFAIGFAGIPIDEAWFGAFFPHVATSPALGAAVSVVLAGMLAAFGFFLPRVRSVARLSTEQLETELLRQMVETLSNRTEDGVRIEQGQQLILGATKDLATVVNRLGRSQRLIIQEIKDTVGPEALNRWVSTAEAWPATIEHATTELRAILAALDVSIARLAEVVASAPRDAGSLSQLSSEFGKLLHDIDEIDHPATEPTG